MGLDIKADPKVFGKGDLTGEKLDLAIRTALLNVSNKFRKTLSNTYSPDEISDKKIKETQ